MTQKQYSQRSEGGVGGFCATSELLQRKQNGPKRQIESGKTKNQKGLTPTNNPEMAAGDRQERPVFKIARSAFWVG